MTATGSPSLWRLAERFDVVPTPPDPVLARLLGAWWESPRSFGCAAARTGGGWFVVAPDPAILCAGCAAERFDRERRCLYCGRDVRPKHASVLVFEMRTAVWVMARCHRHCAERAAKEAT